MINIINDDNSNDNNNLHFYSNCIMNFINILYYQYENNTIF